MQFYIYVIGLDLLSVIQNFMAIKSATLEKMLLKFTIFGNLPEKHTPKPYYASIKYKNIENNPIMLPQNASG